MRSSWTWWLFQLQSQLLVQLAHVQLFLVPSYMPHKWWGVCLHFYAVIMTILQHNLVLTFLSFWLCVPFTHLFDIHSNIDNNRVRKKSKLVMKICKRLLVLLGTKSKHSSSVLFMSVYLVRSRWRFLNLLWRVQGRWFWPWSLPKCPSPSMASCL